MFEIILSPLAILLSLSTSTGMLLHETKVDKLASLSLLAPVTAVSNTADNAVSLDGLPHTHIERASLDHLSSELRTQNPSTTPRKEDKKYRLQKKVSRGFHAFDRYNLPHDPESI